MPQVPQQFFANGAVPLDSQVAGHTFDPETNSVGLLKNAKDMTVLKPLGKPQCGMREIQLYETVKEASKPDLIALKKLIPDYYGVIKMAVNGRELEFIKLRDLTHGIRQPCIIDLKVGKRTWDPLATPQKRAAEEGKYAACKQNLGMCIPGFQVYSLKTGKIQRFGKDYGKDLNETTFKDALKLFLNAETIVCKQLILQILSQLWAIQKWARTQTTLKLYASSILLIYDAERLRTFLNTNEQHSENSNGSIPHHAEISPSSGNTLSKWIDNDEELRKMHDNYVYIQDNNGEENDDANSWVRVKMIDFAHAFPSDDNSIDTNYLFGIENLVKIFEAFLQESY